MARFTMTCFLSAVFTLSICWISASEVPRMDTEEFPTSTGAYQPRTDSRVDVGTAEIGAVSVELRDKLLHMMESHLLRKLKLSSRPAAGAEETTVPGYVVALQNAVDTVPLSSTTHDGSDPFTWALKAARVVPESNVTSVRFDVAARSRDSAPWRVELVFESALPSPRARVQRGRTKVGVCRQRPGGHGARCRRWKPVRYRQYIGLRRRYSVYDVTAAVAPSLVFCHSKPCRLELRVHGAGRVDVANTLTILVIYQNMIPNLRATRRALRSGPTDRRPREGRQRRGLEPKGRVPDRYCQPYKWMVDFRVLNWTWIRAPDRFEAGCCAGRCPSDGRDLDFVNLTNHAFLRMVHRAWGLDVRGTQLPAPQCVSVRYSPLNILFRPDENTYELRTVSDMISDACGCL